MGQGDCLRVGVDLGTTYSLISVEQSGRLPVLVPDHNDRRLVHTPSVVYIAGSQALVGREAEKACEMRPDMSPIRFFKRQLGETAPVWQDTDGASWYAEGLAALVLKKLKIDAEAAFSKVITGAVITVPAHFLDTQRNAVLRAAVLADLTVVDLIDEPIAAALYYRARIIESGDPLALNALERPFFVYDFGGGTFDATVITLAPAVEVKSKLGKTQLGGKDLDDKVSQLLVDQYEKAVKAKFNLSARNLLALRRAAEEIKIKLCTPGTIVVERDLFLGERGIHVIIRKSDFEGAIRELVEATISASEQCISEASLAVKDIGTVLLVGGSSWVPLVQKRLGEMFSGAHQRVLFNEPTKAVAIGAGMHVGQAGGGSLCPELSAEFRGVTGYSVGIRTLDVSSGRATVETLIKRNQPLPARATKRFFTTRSDQKRLRFEILQYQDQADQGSRVGELVVGPLMEPGHDYPIDVNIDYRTNGILSVTASDPKSGRTLTQEFGKQSQESARLLSQQALFRSVAINNV